MPELTKITIQWMDREEPFIIDDCCETRISDGVLHIYKYTGATSILKGEHHYPLANIRHWDKERR